MTKSVMERSHAPLTSWAIAFHLYASSKKGFTATQLERILGAIFSRFSFENPEISLEANADDITPELLHAWQALDIHRISIGVQSFDDAALRHLGRRHDAATARRACAWVAERFGNWSLDLIFGARPVEAWRPTLEEAGRF